jgi:hypothetical protein
MKKDAFFFANFSSPLTYFPKTFSTFTFLSILFVFSLLLSTSASAATRVFYDGSESGNTNLWSQLDYRNKCTSVTSPLDGGAGPHSGSRMIRCNWDGVAAWNSAESYEALSLTWSYTNEFLIRLWVRSDSDVDSKFGSKWLRLYNQGVNSFILDGQMEQAGGPIYSNIESVDGTSTNYNNWGSALLGNQGWHKVELYVKHGISNDAIFRVWVDGSLQYQRTGFSSSPANKWYPLIFVSNWSNNGPEWAHDTNNHTYWDDVEIYSDSTGGTAATGSMSDATVQVNGGGGDTTPPVLPANFNLAASATSQSSITVTWNPATDNVGVTGYIVERCQGSGCSNFTQVGTPTASPFVDTGLTANTFYNYHARATDAAGNLSGWSNVVGATTQGTTSGATRVFYDGSESGNVNLWAASDGTRSPCQSVVSALDGGGPAVGSRMLRCNWNGVVPWNDYNSYDTLQLNSWNYTNEMLMRFWIRLDQDMDYKDGAKLFRLGFGGDSDTFWQRDPVSQSGGTHEAWYVNGNAIINAWGAHNFEDHQWHKIEIYIKSDTGPNGAIKVWMDNALTNSYQYPYTGITAVGSSRWYPFNLMSNWSSNPGWEHDANNHVYWDDIEIYTDSSSGTPATGSLSNASIQANGGGTPTPTFTLSANPTSITSGASSTLTWSAVTNATSCTASGGTFTGSKPTSGGTQSVSPTSTTTYTLSCTGAGGTTNQSATVTVTNPTERIIDNTDSTVSQSGAWSPSTNFPGYYGANYHYSPNQSGEWFEWQATGLTAGTYQVFAYWNANADRPTDVSYRITHSGGATTINNINQTQSGSQWNLLGTYTFGTTGTVRVISGATGTEGTVADAVRFVRTNTIPCNTVTTANFSQSAYNSYGAPFDAFQTSTNLISANCNSADTHTIQATLGQTGDTTRIAYTKGYYYANNAWTQYTGTCTGALNGEWCQGSVSATITNPNISTASASAAAYFVGMTCSVQSGGWKCGCRDTTCSNFYWQIQGAGQ